MKNNKDKSLISGSVYKFPPMVTFKDETQEKFYKTIADNHITFGIGPAGVGKTCLSVAYGVHALRNNGIKKIVITRPAIEAVDDHLGHLPGNVDEKMSMYMMPVLNEFHNFANPEEVITWAKAKIVEIIPIAYIRGLTFKNTVLIVDEASNCTYEQLKLIMTRIGDGAKIIINGDPSQSDLPKFKRGGLEECVNRLSDMAGIGVVEFSHTNIVRHPMIQELLERLG